jgi:hypothetical protein
MRHECDRTRLIAELASLLRDCELPDEARTAGLTLIGYLARRMPGEDPSTVGVIEVTARAAEVEVAVCSTTRVKKSSFAA